MVPKNLIPVSDAAGTVVAVGQGVTRFRVGDRVNSHLYARWIDGEPARVYPFGEAVQAFGHLARGPFGNVVIRVTP